MGISSVNVQLNCMCMSGSETVTVSASAWRSLEPGLVYRTDAAQTFSDSTRSIDLSPRVLLGLQGVVRSTWSASTCGGRSSSFRFYQQHATSLVGSVLAVHSSTTISCKALPGSDPLHV
jgi:hypothetical protein